MCRPIFLFVIYLKLIYCEVNGQPESCQDLHEFGVANVGYNVAYDNTSKPFIIYCAEEDGLTIERHLVTSSARNCYELQQQGMESDGPNIIYPFASHPETPVLVYCDQTTDQGGWTVIQRRIDGTQDFYKGWEEYEDGFGSVDAEFWLGNIVIHELTEQTVNELLIELEDWNDEQRYAHYKIFHIADNKIEIGKTHHYQIDIALYSGTAGDSFSYHDGEEFSTFDSDNDDTSVNCAEERHGAWWYVSCAYCNLNGRYYDHGDTGKLDGIQWSGFHGDYYSHKRASMKIRPYQGELYHY